MLRAAVLVALSSPKSKLHHLDSALAFLRRAKDAWDSSEPPPPMELTREQADRAKQILLEAPVAELDTYIATLRELVDAKFLTLPTTIEVFESELRALRRGTPAVTLDLLSSSTPSRYAADATHATASIPGIGPASKVGPMTRSFSTEPDKVVGLATHAAVCLKGAFERRDRREAETQLASLADLLSSHPLDGNKDWKLLSQINQALAWAIGGWFTTPVGGTRDFAVGRRGSPMLSIETKTIDHHLGFDIHHDHVALERWRSEGSIEIDSGGPVSIRRNADERIGHNDWDFFKLTARLPAGTAQMWTQAMRASLARLAGVAYLSEDNQSDVHLLLMLTSKDPDPRSALPDGARDQYRFFSID
jgi:hypothetical protein